MTKGVYWWLGVSAGDWRCLLVAISPLVTEGVCWCSLVTKGVNCSWPVKGVFAIDCVIIIMITLLLL